MGVSGVSFVVTLWQKANMLIVVEAVQFSK
jgi:hypothetical protein